MASDNSSLANSTTSFSTLNLIWFLLKIAAEIVHIRTSANEINVKCYRVCLILNCLNTSPILTSSQNQPVLIKIVNLIEMNQKKSIIF